MNYISNLEEHNKTPFAPSCVSETGISANSLLRILIKVMHVQNLELGSEIADVMKIPKSVVAELFDEALAQKLVESKGSVGMDVRSEIRYGLTSIGRAFAGDAMALSQYIGPAPVSIESYYDQINKQLLVGERVERSVIESGLSGYVVPESLVRQLGQATNSGKSLLLYGAPGNGKTTLAEIIGGVFRDVIYIPYCLEVDGNIIKVFDGAVHQPVREDLVEHEVSSQTSGFKLPRPDKRWVACRRPALRAGGELSLEMLDLQFNPHSRYYEAPLHVKAIGGSFLIDDLGRQFVDPEALLNRWITPMEKRVDYLTLNSGRTFTVPFDVLVIFSTNLTPEDLMDPAFLRRIPYKVEVENPSDGEFHQVFKILCDKHQLEYNESMVSDIMNKITNLFSQPLAFYQPRFIIEQIIAACKYDGLPVRIDNELVDEALNNLGVKK